MKSAHFGSLSERMAAFREEVLDEKPYIDAERAILATEAYRENLNQPRHCCVATRQQRTAMPRYFRNIQ